MNDERLRKRAGIAVIIASAALAYHIVSVFRRGAIDRPYGSTFVSMVLAYGLVIWASFLVLRRSLSDTRGEKPIRSRWNPLLAGGAVLMVAVAIGLVLPPGGSRFGPVARLGYRALYADRFGSWANDILSRPPEEVPRAQPGSTVLANTLLPPGLRNLHRWRYNVLIKEAHRSERLHNRSGDRYLALLWTDDVTGWGLLLGPPTLHLKSNEYYHVTKLAPGAYRWD
jgi:hypothetical protein